MSFLLRTSRIAAAARPASRAFSASSWRALKEGERNVAGAGEDSEKHIQDQISKQKEGKGHWKPELASNSEEAVRHVLLSILALRVFNIGRWMQRHGGANWA